MGKRDTTNRQNEQSYRIVVGVGRGGETSEHAVREALALATRGDSSEVHVVTALAESGSKLDGVSQLMSEEETWLVDYVRWVADRTILRPAEIPAGVLTAIVGGPGLIWILRATRSAS